MLLYFAALVLVVGSWYWFINNIQMKKSNLPLVVVVIVYPFLYFAGGLAYSWQIHSQGAAITAAGIAYFLFLNSLVIVAIIAVLAIKNKRKRNSA
ncbi:hypothetical protein [Bacillus marinisedimentorum]|uniref:hypothetical protein n=1 Tax=Bacillus marinisedimentorum TaxID=1821260 RepID=UPI0008723C75|nr:hypothetical protein [Bacillus marinisedimentorum]